MPYSGTKGLKRISMKTLKIKSKWAFQLHLIARLLLLPFLMIILLTACNGTGKPNNNSESKVALAELPKAGTFQELGFFGSIKEDKWDDFLFAVKHNIFNSRKEAGNLSFSLYQPENGKLQPIWFERFKDKKAHNLHKEQRYFKDAITVIQKSLKEEVKSIQLKELTEIPVVTAASSNRPRTTRYVIVLFHVKPEKRQFFINNIARSAPLCRKAEGNLEFNLYQSSSDPNKFVLMEGWESASKQEAHLKLDHIKQLNTNVKGFFVSNPMDTSWIVKDISQ